MELEQDYRACRAFTVAERLRQISRLSQEQKTFEEMLVETGLQAPTLRNYLMRAGLRMPTRLRLEVKLSADVTSAVIHEAGKRHLGVKQFVGLLFDAITKDKLYTAILDDQ